MTTDREIAARQAYLIRFGNVGPEPFGVDGDKIAAELERAVASGQPIPDDFDWYRDLPDGAVS